MAFYTNSLDAPHTDGVFARAVAALTNFFAQISYAQSRVDKINRLLDLSDDELAKIGLKRTDIVRHVYRDTYHI